MYKCMLLLKKKKYAAVKLGDGPNGGEVLEAKGLDIVRRDWCPLSKEAGSYALNQILSGECWVLAHDRPCFCSRPTQGLLIASASNAFV